MALHLTEHRRGFLPGLTEITRLDEPDGTGVALASLVLAAGVPYRATAEQETAVLLLGGEVALTAAGGEHRLARASLFDDPPSCVQLAAGERYRIDAGTEAELLVFSTVNAAAFAPRLYLPKEVRQEQRGRGQVGDAAHRIVRTIFDRTNAPAGSLLVLGEVVNLPGRWSSYPPHHHAQPEMYHYRFEPEHGWGHAELGEQVLKVRSYDTVKIVGGKDHPQCAAPGYAMWYAWVIRHLPGLPYEAPEFVPEHTWVMEPGAKCWSPR